MKYERFEDVPVWQDSADLAAEMFPWAGRPEFRELGDLTNQLQRAALSISNNIAEGFERGTTNELIAFLYYARGSAGEVRSMLAVINRMPELQSMRSDAASLSTRCESISRQIRGWTNSLQNSDITGQRHLNDKTRADYDRKQGQAAAFDKHRKFMQELEAKLKKRGFKHHLKTNDRFQISDRLLAIQFLPIAAEYSLKRTRLIYRSAEFTIGTISSGRVCPSRKRQR
ncbi:MAG: four helix bundle protein [Pirellulaceae bacterium]